MDLAKFTQRGETARYRSLNMRFHRQISVDVNAQIKDEQRWGDRNASDQYCRSGQLMLTASCRTPQEL